MIIASGGAASALRARSEDSDEIERIDRHLSGLKRTFHQSSLSHCTRWSECLEQTATETVLSQSAALQERAQPGWRVFRDEPPQDQAKLQSEHHTPFLTRHAP